METMAGAAPKLCSTYLHLFVLALIICSGVFTPQAQELPPEELAALKSVGKKLGKEWNFDVNPCDIGTGGWVTNPTQDSLKNNVTCQCKGTICHVVAIVLKGQNLSGQLPPELANLTSLRELDLTRNYLSGQIPAAWAALPLTILSLLGNRISGKIPKEIGNITTLLELVLDDNRMEGSLPPELGNLKNLERLLIASNNFEGLLPMELGKLKNLMEFRINDNSFIGTIPDFIQNWTKLSLLQIQGVSLRGPLPSSISVLTNLVDLRISDLSRPVSTFPDLSKMRALRRLILRNCFISDELPRYFGDGNNFNLRQIDLSFNSLTGKIPENYASLQLQIDRLYLSNNMLTGTIPQWIKILIRTDLSYNNFTGVPLSESCQSSVLNLVASYSDVENIPFSCLRKNLPCPGRARNSELFINCGGGNMIIGNRKYEADQDMLGEASFYSSPSGRWAVSNTGRFQDGNLRGFIATANKSELSMINQDLYMTARRSALSLKYYGFCLQEGSYNVTLHFAEIEFTDDKTFSSLGRRIFDVSIQGEKVLKDFNIQNQSNGHPGVEVVKTFTTNVTNVTNHTLEIHLFWAGKGTAYIPVRGVYGPLISAIAVTPNFTPKMFGSKLSVGAIVGIVVASSVVVFLILVILWMKGFLGGKVPVDKELKRSLELQTGYFTLRQIKEATNNFDPANKIGEGGFGPVYKGELRDGSIIAVKQLSSKSKQGNREFVNEIGMISALQHPNLVKLLGCSIDGDQLFLIYEYMENNSLARALFGPEESRLNLDWSTRRKIFLGIARGLAYLHEESRLKIVHRDIKGTNVLLDKNLEAKISDFGLAKLDEEENTHISTRIAGTIGYMAPEYATRGYLTDKADVYSFGVVGLEIVSGKSNTSHSPKEESIYLLDWAYVLQARGDLLELVDPSLGANFSKEEALTMLNLALLCTSPSPTLRPTMSAVVSMFEGRTALQVPLLMSSASSSTDHWRFKAVEMLFEHSETHSMSMEGPLIGSSASNRSKDEDVFYTSKE